MKTRVVSGASESLVPAGLTNAVSLRVPKYGQKAAVVNELGTSNNANTLTQQFTVTAADVDPNDGKIHVRFALAPVLQSGGHPAREQHPQRRLGSLGCSSSSSERITDGQLRVRAITSTDC